MQQSIVKCYCLWLTNRPRLRTLPPPHSYGNQRLQWQFDGLLMMCIIMPETCWAVSVRQNNKTLRLIVASSWLFYLSDWRCTEPLTLKTSEQFFLNLCTGRSFTESSSFSTCALNGHLLRVTIPDAVLTLKSPN